jgi:hypothetical protein
MAFPCDVVLVVIAVGIPRLVRQCDAIMNQSGACGQIDLGLEARMWRSCRAATRRLFSA